ncbi:hypothetical protein KR093_003291, partial [Drosophila rubida]
TTSSAKPTTSAAAAAAAAAAVVSNSASSATQATKVKRQTSTQSPPSGAAGATATAAAAATTATTTTRSGGRSGQRRRSSSSNPNVGNTKATSGSGGAGCAGVAGGGGGGGAGGGTANIKQSVSRNSNIRSSSSNSTMASANHHRGGRGGAGGGVTGPGAGGAADGNAAGLQFGSAWFQRKINLRPQHRGVHLVTEEILRQMPELTQFSVGLCHMQILHTSASLALNESWDPDVRDDMEMMLNKIVPEGLPYRHSCEGPDDMPAHVKACFLGSSLTIPITDGKLSLGTWQGVWLCEHRDQAGSRKLVITLTGCPREQAAVRSPLSPVSPIASTSTRATAQQRAAAVIAAGRGLIGATASAAAPAPPTPSGAPGAAGVAVDSKTARLLLRQRLHLNLNLNVTETLRDGVDIDDVDEDVCDYDCDDSNERQVVAASSSLDVADVVDAQGSGRRRVGDNIQTVTTVPQTKQQQQQLRHKITAATTTAATTTTTTSSSAASSALAKFNRIIDSVNLEAHRASAAFSSATLQQRLALAYPELQQQQPQQQQQPHSDMRQIDNLPRSTSRGIAAVSTPLTLQALDTIKTKAAAMEMQQKQNEQQQQQHDAADQTKRNDVHYLLKQLNSFSDIEEIEIVDMKQREQRQQQQQQQQQQEQQQLKQPQQRQQRTTKAAAASSLELMPMSSSMLPIPGSPSTQSHKGNFMGCSDDGEAVARLQFDDYLFESCHYLETNYFAATYRTAMVESCSHEFRPSTTTPTSTRSDCFELHELEPPSVICKAAPPPSLSPPPYQAEARMTSSGVQTELTVDSLAQLSHNSSSSSSGSMPRVPPFFICCYTPIDRWRARRLGAAQRAAKHAGNPEKNGHA